MHLLPHRQQQLRLDGILIQGNMKKGMKLFPISVSRLMSANGCLP